MIVAEGGADGAGFPRGLEKEDMWRERGGLGVLSHLSRLANGAIG